MARPTNDPKGEGPLLSEWICERLENAIVERKYPPGTHLKEDEVAAELGVSRTPVREAFRMLQRAGWLDLRARAGAHVRYPSIEDIRDVFELRQELEQWGAHLAAQRIQETDIKALRRTVMLGREALARQDVEGMAELNSVFHQQLAAATRNRRLEGLLKDLARLIQWHFSVVAHEIGEDSWTEHADIVAALEAGDGELASSIIGEHISGTRRVFLQTYLLEEGPPRARHTTPKGASEDGEVTPERDDASSRSARPRPRS